MMEKRPIKIRLFTILLFITILIVIEIFSLYDFKEKISEISSTKEDSTVLINTKFELNTKNKYTIITDMKWKTMQNDGGSHTNIYYQLDLDNNAITKIKEDFQANLGGLPSTRKSTIYVKKIDSNIKNEAKLLLEELLIKEDINKTNNYNCFTILNLDYEKDIYNINTIKLINNLLKKIDNF